MKINLIIVLALAASQAGWAAAEDRIEANTRLALGKPFLDPVFQDYIETSGGYLNSKNTMQVRTDFSDFRDAPSALPVRTLKNPVPAAKLPLARPAAPAPAAETAGVPPGHYKVTFAGEGGPVGSFVWPLGSGPGKYAREYVFMTVTPDNPDYSALLSKLESETGFRFVGEKIFYSGNSRTLVILGWVPAANRVKVAGLSGVARVVVGRQGTGVPLKTKVRFTLKVPYQNRPAVFVPGFLRRLADQSGFSAETLFRLPQNSRDSKFSVFDVTGTLPVDMIGELSRSPFVGSIEFRDSSL